MNTNMQATTGETWMDILEFLRTNDFEAHDDVFGALDSQCQFAVFERGLIRVMSINGGEWTIYKFIHATHDIAWKVDFSNGAPEHVVIATIEAAMKA